MKNPVSKSELSEIESDETTASPGDAEPPSVEIKAMSVIELTTELLVANGHNHEMVAQLVGRTSARSIYRWAGGEAVPNEGTTQRLRVLVGKLRKRLEQERENQVSPTT